MKDFKKSGFWVLFAFIVLMGSLVIVNFSFQKQSPGIPDVNAQPGQALSNFIGDTFYAPQADIGSHPSNTFFVPRESNSPGNPNDDYYMPGVLTMPTASTCVWDCNPTFATCPPNPETSTTCSSGLSGNCVPTSSTCSSGIFCDGGPMPTSSTCSGGIFCNGGPMPTSSTCSGGIFCNGGPMPTSSTCSGGIFCNGGPMPTSSTCSGGIFCNGGPMPTSSTCSGGSSVAILILLLQPAVAAYFVAAILTHYELVLETALLT